MTLRVDRFWSKVDMGGPDECWNWTAALDDGYGNFGLDGQSGGTHRIAWILTNGPIPAGKHVLHKCDNRACCNPAHLYLGTHQDNMADKARSGVMKGEHHPNAKLTNAQRKEICRRYKAGGISQYALAAEFSVDQATISHVVHSKIGG